MNSRFLFSAAQETDDGDTAAGPDDLHGGSVGGPWVRRQNDQVDAAAGAELVQLRSQIRVVAAEEPVGPHALGHFQAQVAVADGGSARPIKGPDGDGAQAQRPQPDHGHGFARPDKRLVIAMGAQGIEIPEDSVLGVNAVRDLDQDAPGWSADVFRLVMHLGQDAVSHLKSGDVGADAPDLAQVAVSYPAGINGGSGDVLGPFVVAAVGPDLEPGHDGPDPNLVRRQIRGIELVVFDPEVPGAVQNGDLHLALLLVDVSISVRFETANVTSPCRLLPRSGSGSGGGRIRLPTIVERGSALSWEQEADP